MILAVKSEQELEKANRIGRRRLGLGQAVDPILYDGERGRFVMVFSETEYVPEFTLKNCSLAFGFDSYELEKIIIKPKHRG